MQLKQNPNITSKELFNSGNSPYLVNCITVIYTKKRKERG